MGALEERVSSTMSGRKLLIFGSISVVLGVVVGGVIILFLRLHDGGQGAVIPRTYADAVNFPLYQPAGLPNSFSMDKNSFSANQNVLSYTYKYQKDKQIVVNIQALPPGFDSSAFNPTKQFSTNIGTAYLADTGTRVTAAVVNSKSLILVNAPSGINADIMEQFIDSLQPAK